MIGQEKVMGMVLSAAPFGDYDKRLVVLTKERGRITVFAKGARRPTSQFLGCSQPFVFGDFQVYRGKSAYTLVSAEISNYFSELREDYAAVYYAFYFCEFAEFFSQENVDGGMMLKLLYQSFRALIKKPVSPELIRCIFELKIMAVEGQAPLMFSCVKCGREGDFLSLSIKSGGILCPECCDKINGIKIDGAKSGIYTAHSKIASIVDGAKSDSYKSDGNKSDGNKSDGIKSDGTKNVRLISKGCRYTMQYIISSKIEELYTFTVTEEILAELKRIIKDFLDEYVNHEFKSLCMLEVV